MTPHDPTAAGGIVAALNRFTNLVNRGAMPEALACFAASPSIVEDIAPFHWEGPAAGADWLAAMAANAEAEGVIRIELRLDIPDAVMVAGERGYAVFPGHLTLTPAEGPPQRLHGHLTFVVAHEAADWRIETLNWSRESVER